ncbi:single-stranded-DNA-specific exonuclease RecJ [Acidobacteria bacterium AH-259-D05]|nr:single-stranded-DNA-specific exonuclease RecJ [Acidobacteria bacterium AH-259-D05]
MKYRWSVLTSFPKQIELLSTQLGVSSLVAHLLLQRGFDDPTKAQKFLEPRLEDLHDPYLMKDMDRVVERILRARDMGEKILIYGDYDVDGITATVVLKRALEMLGISADFYLPRRLEEGYGVKNEVLKKAREDGYSLVITADNGIRAFEAADAARELGLELIVTDHHIPEDSLPLVYAILNPHRPDCTYPDKHLAAVGVVFKLVSALFRKVGREGVIGHFLKLVAIGTVADLVPITGENRILVRFGLEGLSDPRNPGLKALLRSAGIKGEVSLSDVAFRLAPRINAVTRMGGGREVVELFFVRDQADARAIVREMNTKNTLRRQEEKRILMEIEERFRQDPQDFDRKFLVVAGRHWHRGVIGIVASRLVERFNRPALVLSIEDSFCQGSGRSVPGLDLLEAFDGCRDLFKQYGGHAQAVGCVLDEQFCQMGKIQDLARSLEEHIAPKLPSADLIPSLSIDSFLPAEDISFTLYEAIERLAPFGMGNPVPVFASKKVNIVAGPWVLKEQHLKMQVQCNGSRLDAIWWKNGSFADTINTGSQVDLAYTMSRDNYLGEKKLLLTIQDIHLP